MKMNLEEEHAEQLDRFDPRKIVAQARARGLVQMPDDIGRASALQAKKTGRPAAAAAGLRTVWIDVTPAMAEEWLRTNFRNRPVSLDVVNGYAREMRAGTWVATHQGIAFNERDELIDGQHRLKAVIKAGVTVRMMATFDLPSRIEGSAMTTMDAVDRGRQRSVADQLKIQHGLKNSSTIAPLSVVVSRLCCQTKTRRLSVGEVLLIYETWRNEIDWMAGHDGLDKRFRMAGHDGLDKRFRMAGLRGAFVFAAAAEKKARGLFAELIGGAELGGRRALRHLREFLLSDEAVLLTRRSDVGLAELTLEALRLELAGAKVSKLEPGRGGLEHFIGRQQDRVAVVKDIFEA